MRNWWCQCTSPAPRWSPVAVSDTQSTAGRACTRKVGSAGPPQQSGSGGSWQAAAAAAAAAEADAYRDKALLLQWIQYDPISQALAAVEGPGDVQQTVR